MSLAVVAVLFVFAIPAITGSGYAEIFETIEQLTWSRSSSSSAFWMLVMLAYSGVLTDGAAGADPRPGAGPQLRRQRRLQRRAVRGAAGVAATYAMTMSWGFRCPR